MFAEIIVYHNMNIWLFGIILLMRNSNNILFAIHCVMEMPVSLHVSAINVRLTIFYFFTTYSERLSIMPHAGERIA